jgi:hypothetical protein
MAGTHIFLAFTATGSLHPSYEIAAGRAAALFAVLAGVSLALAHGGPTPPQGRRLRAARAGVLARAGFLLVVGMLLARVDSPPLVILPYYALLFVVAIGFLGLRARTLAWLAAGAALATPVLSHLLRQHLEQPGVGEPGGPDLLVDLGVTGTYPVLTWTTYLFAGLAVGRTDLRPRTAGVRLLAVGGVLAVSAKALSSVALDAAGGAARLQQSSTIVVNEALGRGLFGTTPADDWQWLLVSAPHSGTTFDLVHTVGTSLAVLGGCLLLARLLPYRLLLPLAAAGSMTLTLYVAHVLALADGSPVLLDDRTQLWVAHVAVALVAATVWRSVVGRGPLEAASSVLDLSARRAVSGRRVLQR